MNDAELVVNDERIDFQRAKDSIRVVLAQISPAYDPDAFASASLVKIKTPEKQADKICKIVRHASTLGADILLFPELVAPFSHVQSIERTIQTSKKDIVVCIPYEHTSVRDMRSTLPDEEIEQHECMDDAADDRVVNFCRITTKSGSQFKTFTQIKLTPFSVEFSLAASDTLVCGKTVHRFITNWGNFLFLICKDYVGEIGRGKTPMFDFLKSLTTTGLHYVFVSSLNPEPEAFLHAARSFYYMQEKSNSTFSIFLNIAELDNTTIVFPVRPHPGIRPTKKLEMLPLFAGKPSWGTQLRFPGYQERLICGTFVRLDTYEPMATKEIYSPIHHTELIDLTELDIESELVELPKGVAIKEKKEKLLHNLPAQPTRFLGREKELAEIAGRFEDPSCRLVTILGPGGMGKTRLGIQAASYMIPRLKDGVFFVPLAPLSSGDFIVSTIASSLGFSFRGREDQKIQLFNYLRDKELLLVMDNFEHLIEKAELLAGILEAASGVRIIATSRERLNLKGEWVFKVHGMDCPEEEHVEEAAECAVVQLFLEGAQRVRPDFSPSDEEMSRIVRICMLVEGVPLAVELASAWMSVLSCEEIFEEIKQNIDFLATSMRDVPERHKSMRAVFEHSWNLLPEEEKKVFMKMSVFRGGFQKDAARKTTQASLLHLSSLVNKSLLQHYPSGRYAVHELLRQYAEEKLGEVPEEKDKVRDLHSEFYAEFLHQRRELLKGEKQRDVLKEIGDEIDNIRAAWSWAGEKGKSNVIDKSVRSLWRFYMIRGWFQDGEEIFERVAENVREAVTKIPDKEKELVLGKILARQGVFSYQLGHFEKATQLFESSISTFREVGAQQEAADTLNEYSRVYFVKGDYAQAREMLEECLTLCKKLGYRKGMAAPYTTLGNIAYRLGELKDARQFYERSHRAYKESGDKWGLAIALMNLANVTHEIGEHMQAKRIYEHSLAISEEIGDRRGIAANLNNMGNVAKDLGEYAEAKELYQKSLAIKKETGDRKGIAASLGNLGTVAYVTGQYDDAKHYHQEMLALCREIGYPWGIISALVGLGADASGLGERDEAMQYFRDSLHLAIDSSAVPLALDAVVEIASLLHDKKRALALYSFVSNHASCYVHTKKTVEQRWSKLAAQLPADVVEAAQQEGKAMELEDIAAELLKEMT
ncbi:hypothetical protein AMJ87_05260 [candidate division WOR_3 bacterium SM23_60]|uniref:NB-ARC domain-containing protein n=1 Tax=candidate division WOR_3 bacterium SM23_60 TaxID=1703780 RepID=A0A0S8GKT9_UNCW3|nr:MAG: hypothetical protein AMJ87_05260 [candidate division WOR_3 bacterium SM23_60]